LVVVAKILVAETKYLAMLRQNVSLPKKKLVLAKKRKK